MEIAHSARDWIIAGLQIHDLFLLKSQVPPDPLSNGLQVLRDTMPHQRAVSDGKGRHLQSHLLSTKSSTTTHALHLAGMANPRASASAAVARGASPRFRGSSVCQALALSTGCSPPALFECAASAIAAATRRMSGVARYIGVSSFV